jgi:hypothetical protein
MVGIYGKDLIFLGSGMVAHRESLGEKKEFAAGGEGDPFSRS